MLSASPSCGGQSSTVKPSEQDQPSGHSNQPVERQVPSGWRSMRWTLSSGGQGCSSGGGGLQVVPSSGGGQLAGTYSVQVPSASWVSEES
jgi:hypothetical protein